jgi:hypothetical protein
MSDQTERAKFEAWMRSRSDHYEYVRHLPKRLKFGPDLYHDEGIQIAWDSWKARAAQPAAEPVAWSEHDLSVIADLEALAKEQHSGFWPRAIASAALRMIRRTPPVTHPAPAAEPPSDALDAKRWRWLADDMDGDAQCDFITDLHRCVYGRIDLDKKADAAIAAHEAKRP